MTQDETPPQGETPEETPEEAPDPSPQPPEESPAAQEETPAAPAEEETPAAPAEEAPAAPAEEAPAAEEDSSPSEKPRKRGKKEEKSEEELIPGAHLVPDLVLEEEQAAEAPEESYAGEPEGDAVEPSASEEAQPAPVAATPLDLAADARYQATGKRKSAVARVILKPGKGTYVVNGRELDQFFPRHALQRIARQPLEATGNDSRMDVVARIHGGGVAAQASALRHGIARALVEADPNLRIELKRRGYLTRDPRVKERKKAGLKKARKRPQFSKR